MIYTSVLLPVAIASYYAVAGVRHMALTELAIAIFLVELLMKCIKINNQVHVSFYWCIYHFQSHNKKRLLESR